MAARDLHQRSVQGSGIEPSAQPEQARQVVDRRVRLQLVQEPEPALRVRERQSALVRNALEHGGGTRGVGRAFDDRRQPRDRRPLEDLPNRDLDPKVAPDARSDPHGEQGVAAKLEKALMDPDPLDLQHLAPDGRQPALDGIAGSDGTLLDAGSIGRRQSLAIHLAVGRQRQGFKKDPGGRHHVLGETLLEMGAKLRSGRQRIRSRHDVGGQPLVPRDEDRRLHLRVPEQRGLDFLQLDTEAADLDLVVNAAQVLDLARPQIAREIACEVEALSGNPLSGSGTNRSAVSSGRPR